MPRLIMLNGPPGCGKSTLAQMYLNEHPMTLNLGIDRIRGLIGRWRDAPETAGPLARAIALAAARTHLRAGHDVVIPQFLGLSSERGRAAADSAHVKAQEMLERSGGLNELSVMYDRLLPVLASRPTARVVPTTSGQVERAYRDFLSKLS